MKKAPKTPEAASHGTMTGAEIKAVREAIPMSLREFSAALDVSLITCFRWETKGHKPRPAMIREIRKLAKKHGVPA